MKKVFILLTFTIVTISMDAQPKWLIPSKNELISYGFVTLSGVAKGYNQALLFRGYRKGDQFWDPKISWKNKYKNYPYDKGEKFLGSKTVFVMVTDGHHLTQFLDNTFLVTGTIFLSWNLKSELKNIPKGQRIPYILWRKIFIPTLLRTASFEYTFNNL